MIFFDLYDLESPKSGRPACLFKSLLQVCSILNKKWVGDPYYVYGAKWISRFFRLVDFFCESKLVWAACIPSKTRMRSHCKSHQTYYTPRDPWIENEPYTSHVMPLHFTWCVMEAFVIWHGNNFHALRPPWLLLSKCQ